MKNLFKVISAIILASLFFISCSKDDTVVKKDNRVTITFSANKAGVETKTAAVEGATEVSYIWTSEDLDNIKLFKVDDKGALIEEVMNPTITKVSDTKLTISAEVDPDASYTFRAILCNPDNYTGSGTDYSERKPKISTSQTPNGTSNFDPNADILVSEDKTIIVGADGTTTGSMAMVFHRQVVVNRMTLKNLTEGEKISKVVISSDKNLTGYLDNGSMIGQFKEITILYNNEVVPEGGLFPVYFLTMENTEQTLRVTVFTDQNTYVKDFPRTIDLTLGYFTKFNVSLPKGTPVVDLSGYYLIGSRYSSKWNLMSSDNSGTYYNRLETSVTKEASAVDFSDFAGVSDINKYVWKVEAYDGGYSIKSVKTNNYVGYSGSSNTASAESELSASTKFTINVVDNSATIESCNVSGRILQYNSGNPRFACYTTAQEEIFLIPATYDPRESVTLTFDESAVNLTSEDYSSFTGQTVSSDPAVTGIVYSISGDPIGSINSTTGVVNLNGTLGTATVTASFAGDETYMPATANYTINVSSSPIPPTGTILWSETFADYGDNKTNFNQLGKLLSSYDYAGRSGYKENGSSVTLTVHVEENQAIAVKPTTSSGSPCESGHLWFNKGKEGIVTTSAIKLYGVTSLKLTYTQATSGSQLIAGYSVDGTNWTDFDSTGPNATNSMTFTVAEGTQVVYLRFTHPSSNNKNTRFDNPTLTVGE